MTKITLWVAAAVGTVVLAGCATAPSAEPQAFMAMMKASFSDRGIAKVDRLEQDLGQAACSSDKAPTPELAKRVEAEAKKTIKWPADGQYLGDWKRGEQVAQRGTGFQYSDTEKTPVGGNCYACHQLSKQEISYGTIGPSLYNFGKLRGFTPEMQKYAWGKVYNAHAYAACSNMPRFGAQGILSEQQLKDVVALLMDPKSPVNQ